MYGYQIFYTRILVHTSCISRSVIHLVHLLSGGFTTLKGEKGELPFEEQMKVRQIMCYAEYSSFQSNSKSLEPK